MVLIAGVRRYDDGRAFQILYDFVIEGDPIFFRVFAFQGKICAVVDDRVHFPDFFIRGLFLTHNISYKRVFLRLYAVSLL